MNINRSARLLSMLGFALVAGRCTAADPNVAGRVIVEHVTKMAQRATGGLATVFYAPSQAEGPFFKKLGEREKTTGGHHDGYDITKKAGTYVGWFGIVREIAEDKAKQKTVLTVEHKFFDGFTDAHIMAVSFNGSGDFQATLPGTGHNIEPLSLVRIYGSVSDSKGGQIPQIDAVFVRDWHWRTFTFILAYGTQRGSEKWRKLNRVALNDIYDPNPTVDYYRVRLGERPSDLARQEALRRRLLKVAHDVRPDPQKRFDALVDGLLRHDLSHLDGALNDIYKARAFDALAAVMAEAMKDEDARLRSQAVEILGGMGELAPSSAMGALIRALDDQDRLVRWRSIEALGGIGLPAEAALPALIAMVKDSDASVRSQVVEALGNIGAPVDKIVPVLIAATKDPDNDVRFTTAQALAGLGHPASAAVEPLIERLKNDTDQNVRWSAAMAIGKIDADGRLGVPALTASLKSSDSHVRQFAAMGLASLGRKAHLALAAMKPLLSDSDPGVRVAAAEAVWKVGNDTNQAVPVLNAVLQEGEGLSPMWAADVIAEMGADGQGALPALRKALKNKNSHVRQSAAQALGKMGPVAIDAASDLIDRLGDLEGEVRARAAEALWYISRHPQAIPQLLKEVSLDSSGGQSYAAAAIGRIGAPAATAIPLLRDLRYSRDRWTRKEAAEAVQRLERTVKP